jgi:hypothetical protein
MTEVGEAILFGLTMIVLNMSQHYSVILLSREH